MSDLTQIAPGYTFSALLNTAEPTGFTNALQVIQDGLGRPSPLSLSTISLDINTTMGGGFSIDTVLLTANANQINSACSNSDFSFLTSGLKIPAGTTVQRPAIPVNGAVIRYNITTQHVEIGANATWTNIV